MAKKIKFKNIKKIWFIIIGSLLLISIVLLAIPKSTYQKLFGKDEVNVIPKAEAAYKKTVYVVNNNKQLVGLEVGLEEVTEDDIKDKWELLTTKVNSIASGYYSPIDTAAVLNEYTLENGILTLKVSSDFTRSDGKMAIACVAWTFCNKDVNEVVILIDDVKVSKIGDYEFKTINKSITVNYVFETAYLLEADHTTIIYYENDYLLPVTYFYKDITEADFIVSKLLDENLIVNKAYTFELSEAAFILNMAYDDVLDAEVLKEFSETVKYNLDVDSLTINNNIMTIYQESFIQLDINDSTNETPEVPKP